LQIGTGVVTNNQYDFGMIKIKEESKPRGNVSPRQASSAPVFIKYRNNLNSDDKTLAGNPLWLDERQQAHTLDEGHKSIDAQCNLGSTKFDKSTIWQRR
jgi:hypothetical protein